MGGKRITSFLCYGDILPLETQKNNIALWDLGEYIERSPNVNTLAWASLFYWHVEGNTSLTYSSLVKPNELQSNEVGISQLGGGYLHKIYDNYVWVHKVFQPLKQWTKEIFVFNIRIRCKSGRMNCMAPMIRTTPIWRIIYK